MIVPFLNHRKNCPNYVTEDSLFRSLLDFQHYRYDSLRFEIVKIKNKFASDAKYEGSRI